MIARITSIALCAALAACGGSPTAPASGMGYQGAWSGTTAQGRPISFTVSAGAEREEETV